MNAGSKLWIFAGCQFFALRLPSRGAVASCLAALTSASVLAGCGAQFVHVAPGNSVLVATAKPGIGHPRAVAPAQLEPARTRSSGGTTARPDQGESVADHFSEGTFFMGLGQYDKAIAAFEAAVNLDPTFTDAWNSLALCYQNSGQDQKALAAFRKSKQLTSTH